MTYCSTQQGKSSMYQIICPTHVSTELKDNVANDNSRKGNKRNATQQRGEDGVNLEPKKSKTLGMF